MNRNDITQPKISVKQLAKYCSVCPATVYGWIKTTNIPYLKAGTRFRFDKKAIDHWLKTNGKIQPW